MKVKPQTKRKNDEYMLLMIFKELSFEFLAIAFKLKTKAKCRNWLKEDGSRVSDLRAPRAKTDNSMSSVWGMLSRRKMKSPKFMGKERAVDLRRHT